MEDKILSFLGDYESIAHYKRLKGQVAEDRDIPCIIAYADGMDIAQDTPFESGNYTIRISVHVVTSIDDATDARPDPLIDHQEAVEAVFNRLHQTSLFLQEFDAATEGILYDFMFTGIEEGREPPRNFGTMLKFEAVYCLPA
jgi:hypothetical protein